jgi:hypothetical protein
MNVESWDWSLRIFDHLDVHASNYAAYLLDPDGNNIEALYRDVGNIGHGASPSLS